MIKQRRNSMRTRRYEAALDVNSIMDIAEDICTALNMVDHFIDGDKWEVVYEKGDNFVTVTNTSVDDQMDGLFCGVEIDNIWATCFVPPVREGGDYVVIGRWRWMLPDILDRITALVGCGAVCALERSRRNVRNRSRRSERRNAIRRGRRFESSEQVLGGLPGETLSLALRAGDYHPYYKNRWRKLESLDPDEVFEALELGDILEYSTTTGVHFYMVKQKTDKQIVIHEIESEFSQEGRVPKEGNSDYPAFPPKEKSQKDDFIVRADGITRWGGENRIHVQGIEHYLSVWYGLFSPVLYS